ncbi:hypothetical protein P9112_013907 [Eukaryota sp. TZLM1-RC]
MFFLICFWTLVSFCTASFQIDLSKDFALEAELPQIDSTCVVHAVTGFVDENDLLDAIVFYATDVDQSRSRSFRQTNYQHSVTYHHRVIYDIRSGPRIWQGPDGFFPVKSTGYSEPQPSLTIERSVNTRSCYDSSINNRYYRDWPEAQTFVAADLNDNGQLDVVVVSATGYCHRDYCHPPPRDLGWTRRTYCSDARRTPHINVKTWLLMDIKPDGNFDKVVEGGTFVANTTAIGAESLRVGVTASVEQDSACDNSHLLTVIHGETRALLCLDLEGNLSPTTYLPLLESVDMHSGGDYSSGTVFKINGEWWHMLINRGGEWMIWVDWNKWYKGKFQFVDDQHDASIAVTAVDFDGDGIDDMILIDCSNIGDRCRFWHGKIYSSEFVDYDLRNDDFINEFL